MNYRMISNCRICGSKDLATVVKLGNQYVVDFVTSPAFVKKPIVPLELVMCESCTTVQLSASVNPDLMYKEFWYRSGISESMRASLQDIVNNALLRSKLRTGDAVLDIGCNDGTMLGMYPKGVVRIGVDPSNALADGVVKNTLDLAINDYFNAKSASEITGILNRSVKVITAIAMFYDLDNPIPFLQSVKMLMDDDSIFIIQMNYLMDMLRSNAFDNISHEHVVYYSLTSLQKLLHMSGLTVVDVERNPTNGGSFRVYVKRLFTNQSPTNAVAELLEEEATFGITNKERYAEFSDRVVTICKKLSDYIINKVSGAETIYAYGASTRGTVLMQCITHSVIAGVAERDPNKFKKFMVGSWKYIRSEEDVRPRTKWFFVLPWYFKGQILEREKEWAKAGGKFIFPLPAPHVVRWENESWVEETI
jgi:NDP-4-keto-2,6-dideoxyhexose 3-C-methyltransferase